MGGCTKSGDEVNSPSRLGDSHCFYGPIFLAHNQYFVLGENPDNSIDSRSFGPVPRNTAKGRVLLRFRPSHRFTVFKWTMQAPCPQVFAICSNSFTTKTCQSTTLTPRTRHSGTPSNTATASLRRPAPNNTNTVTSPHHINYPDRHQSFEALPQRGLRPNSGQRQSFSLHPIIRARRHPSLQSRRPISLDGPLQFSRKYRLALVYVH